MITHVFNPYLSKPDFILCVQAMVLHREASSKSQAELSRCEAELKKLVEERDGLKLLYSQKEEEIMTLRAELTRAHRDQTELIERVT